MTQVPGPAGPPPVMPAPKKNHTLRNPRLSSHSLIGFSVNTTNGVSTGEVTARLHYADSTGDVRNIHLVKESGAWHVCDSPL